MNKMMLRRFALLVPFAAAMIVAGCEIAVDFDRTKIPPDDASVQDTGVTDAPSQNDTGTDTDAGNDAGSDSSSDAATDAPADG